MNTKQNKNSTTEIFKRIPLLLILTTLTAPAWLTACASVNRKEESIHTILEKENVLLEKLQAERAQPEITQAVSENETLKKAEVHLALSLEELLQANKTIKSKILKQKQEEVSNGNN